MFGVLWSNLNDGYSPAAAATPLDHALQWTQDHQISLWTGRMAVANHDLRASTANARRTGMIRHARVMIMASLAVWAAPALAQSNERAVVEAAGQPTQVWAGTMADEGTFPM